MHTDVTTNYLGLRLRTPLVVGACPLTIRPDMVRDLTIAGAGAVVLPSLLEEQIVRHKMKAGWQPNEDERRVEAGGCPPNEDAYNGGVDYYLRAITELKRHTGIPIIANVNGCTDGSWLSITKEMEDSGADAIELSFQTEIRDPSLGADAVESALLRAVETVTDTVTIPVSIKLLPFFTSLPNLSWRLTEAGASGVVLFGQDPMWEIRDGELIATSHWSLSNQGQLQTTISGLIRRGTGGPNISIAASGGITTPQDVIRAVIAGADVAMVTSEIYRTGSDAVAHILDGVVHYLQREAIDSFETFVAQCKAANGKSQSRQSQVQPMMHAEDYRDRHPESPRQTGDSWGHSQPSQTD